MIFHIHPDSGVPIYLQLVQQVTHAIETGALRPEDQLPPIRSVAEEVVTNPNTVAKAYRELEYRGIIELRQGVGAFVRANSPAAGQAEAIQRAHRLVERAVTTMRELGLSEPTMRRVFEAELTQERGVHTALATGGKS
ncbi:MAG: GntR family transcriptional regulator [Acidobacteria bacterium]|nr:GntR family transcriptional regulator [Acidobacteriota bacterium]